jgi:hypothetical protein
VQRWRGQPAEVKRAIGSASILNDGRAVFNIAGNKYRIVVWINYPYRVESAEFKNTDLIIGRNLRFISYNVQFVSKNNMLIDMLC